MMAWCLPFRSAATKLDSRLWGPLEIMGWLDFSFHGWELHRLTALPRHCIWQRESGWLVSQKLCVIRNECHGGHLQGRWLEALQEVPLVWPGKQLLLSPSLCPLLHS